MNLGLKGRLLLIFLMCFISNTLFLVGMNVYSNQKNSNSVKEMDFVLQTIAATGQIDKTFGTLVQAWKNIIIRGKDPQSFEKHSNEFETHAISIQTLVTKFKALDKRNDYAENLADFEASFADMLTKYRSSRDTYMKPPAEFQPEEADKAVKGADRMVLDGIEMIVQLADAKAQENKHNNEELQATINRFLVIGSLVCGLLFAFIFQTLLSRITRDFMKANLSLQQVTEEVTTASRQAETVSAELADASNEQASALQESVAALTELSSMVDQTAQLSQDSLKSTHILTRKSEDCKLAMHRLSDAMTLISEANNLLSALTQVINEISNKTMVIDDIVFKTQLLSFNAAIEAARAGEHGRGFAVVADEVNKLAQLSGESSKEIRDLLQTSADRVKSSLDATHLRVGEGRVATDEARSTVEQMTQYLESIAKSIELIADATREQNVGIKQTEVAMNQLDQIALKNAGLADRTKTSSLELRRNGDDLYDSSQAISVLLSGREASGQQPMSVSAPASRPALNTVTKLSARPQRKGQLAADIDLASESGAAKKRMKA